MYQVNMLRGESEDFLKGKISISNVNYKAFKESISHSFQILDLQSLNLHGLKFTSTYVHMCTEVRHFTLNIVYCDDNVDIAICCGLNQYRSYSTIDSSARIGIRIIPRYSFIYNFPDIIRRRKGSVERICLLKILLTLQKQTYQIARNSLDSRAS